MMLRERRWHNLSKGCLGKLKEKKHAWNLQGIKLHTWEDVRLLRIGLAQKLSNTAYDNMISTETLLKMSQWHLSS